MKIKSKKYLILRIHDIVEPLPYFVARPASQPSVPNVCESDYLLREILQILKKKVDAFCIIVELNLQKTAKFLFQKTFKKSYCS